MVGEESRQEGRDQIMKTQDSYLFLPLEVFQQLKWNLFCKYWPCVRETFESLFSVFKLCWYIHSSPLVNVDDAFYFHTVVYLIAIHNFTQNCKENSNLQHIHWESITVYDILSEWVSELVTMVLLFLIYCDWVRRQLFLCFGCSVFI